MFKLNSIATIRSVATLQYQWLPTELGARLIAWHDASSLRVGTTSVFTTLPDLSGNGRTWTVTPSKVAPSITYVNGLAAISSTVVNTSLSEAGTAVAYDDWVMIVVVRPSSTGQRPLFSTRGFAFPVGGTTAYVGTVTNQLFTYHNVSSPASHIGPSFTTESNPHIFEYRWQLSGTTQTVDGSLSTTVARTNCKIWAAGTNMRWFEDLEIPSEFWLGEVCEVIRIDTPTVADLTAARNYLKRKWGTHTVPPQSSSLTMWMDPDVNVTESGGVVDSWASRVGSVTFSNTSTARPVKGSGYIEFDGINDTLTRTADSNSHPASLGKYTFASWVRRDTSALSIVYSSVPFGSGTGITLQDNSATSRQSGLAAGHSINGSLPVGNWVFRATTYDSTKSAGLRTSVYEGTAPNTLQLITPTSDVTSGNASASVGSSSIGSDTGLGRYFNGRVGSMYLYPNVELSLDELKTLASVKVPTLALPPQYQSLITWLDPSVGISSSGGLVDSWTSRVGTATYTAAGVLRPTLGNGYLEFDGVDDYMFRTADAQCHPGGATACTVGMWIWYDALSASIVNGFNTATDSSTVSASATNSTIRYSEIAGKVAIIHPTTTPTGQWVFRALTYSTAGLKQYFATKASTMLELTTTLAYNGVVNAAAGESRVGSYSAAFPRYLDGRIGSIYVYSGVALDVADMQTLVNFEIPQ